MPNQNDVRTADMEQIIMDHFCRWYRSQRGDSQMVIPNYDAGEMRRQAHDLAQALAAAKNDAPGMTVDWVHVDTSIQSAIADIDAALSPLSAACNFAGALNSAKDYLEDARRVLTLLAPRSTGVDRETLAKAMFDADMAGAAKWEDFKKIKLSHENEYYRHADAILARFATPDKPGDMERQLRNLLAVIHRDDGTHTAEVGIEQSVQDAHNVWADLLIALDMGGPQ